MSIEHHTRIRLFRCDWTCSRWYGHGTLDLHKFQPNGDVTLRWGIIGHQVPSLTFKRYLQLITTGKGGVQFYPIEVTGYINYTLRKVPYLGVIDQHKMYSMGLVFFFVCLLLFCGLFASFYPHHFVLLTFCLF